MSVNFMGRVCRAFASSEVTIVACEICLPSGEEVVVQKPMEDAVSSGSID